MNWYKLFYWLTVADNARDFFIGGIVVSMLFFAISIIVYIIYLINNSESGGSDERYLRVIKQTRKWIFWSSSIVILFWSLYVFTPSKKDSLFIIAGAGTMDFLTTDSTAKKLPSEMVNFVTTQLKSLAMDAKVDFETNTQKAKIIEDAKSMSANDLIEKMKSDSNFAKIIMNK